MGNAEQPLTVSVKFEQRDDGGLRAYCDDVPTFVISNEDPDLVISEVPEILGFILSEMLGRKIILTPTVDIAELLGRRQPMLPAYLCDRVYMGQLAQPC